MPPILQRTPSVALVLALALGGLAGCGDSNSGNPVREQLDPYAARAAGFNVLVVSFDTVRTDAIGCYGDPRARTPNIDALAQQGVRFARAISPAPVTLPSHATLFTGLDPLAHGVHNNGTFVLADSGHIAGVVNPPAANKYRYWVSDILPPSSDGWMAYAKEHPGSWWPLWADWLKSRSGDQVAPPRPLKTAPPAPGSYVRETLDSIRNKRGL